MKNLFLALLILGSSAFVSSQTSLVDWVTTLGNDNWTCTATATDPTGNVYITGYYSGTIDFDPGPSTFNLNSNGPNNLFIEKLDANGDFLWAKSMDGGLDYNSSNVITTDESGNVLIAGLYFDTTDFDPGAGTFELAPTGADDIFISKFDTDGNFLWAISIEGELNFISTDMDDNVFLTASFENTIDADPGAGVFNLTSNGASDLLILKLDPTGNFQWAKSIGGIEDDFSSNVTIDPFGNVLVSGLYEDTVDFNPDAAVFNLSNDAGLAWNGQFYALFKLDANGSFIWAKSIGDWELYNDLGSFITTDFAGNIYLTGFESIQGIHVYIQKRDSNGDVLWHKAIAGEHSRGESIVVDPVGSVYLTGKYMNTGSMLDFDPSEEVFDLISNGSTDAYILKLHSNGNFAWAKSFGGIHADNSREISLDASGNLYITGTFVGTVDFDPDAGVMNITSSGWTYDLFVLKLDQLALEVDESEIFDGVKVFPNPNEGLIHLRLDHLKDVEVKIFNPSGQLIYHQLNVNELVHQIELIGPAGFYLMEVRIPNGKNNIKGLTQHYKIVKQ